jgi:hypothetical protein
MAEMEEIICKHCGKLYKPTHRNYKYCGEECSYSAKKIQIKENNKRARENKKVQAIEKRCLVCHHKFSTNRSDVVTCSPYCQRIRTIEQQKKYREIKKEKEKKKAKQQKPLSIAEFDRKAREMGMTYGQYDLYLRMHGKEQKDVV